MQRDTHYKWCEIPDLEYEEPQVPPSLVQMTFLIAHLKIHFVVL